jgi:transcriptional regulator with XRE-family HTH domain
MIGERYLSERQSNFLKSLIKREGLEIGSMAQKMGISRNSLSMKLNGRTDFSRKEMELFACLVKEEPQQIFFAA